MFPQLRIALSLLFFLSGGVALVYEVLWQRLLTLNFGISSFATATILAAFMGGLALGSLVAERVAPGIKSPARAYALLEAGVGLYALMLPVLLEGVMSLYGPLYGAVSSSPILHGLTMAALFFLLLLPPTAMMGATFPILVEAVTKAGGGRAQLGWLYAVNCGGAFCGCLLTAFVLLPGLGLRGSTLLGVGLSLGVGVAAWALSLWVEGRSDLAEAFDEALDGSGPEGVAVGGVSEGGGLSDGPGLWALSLGAAATGGAAMIYELAFFRLLTLQIGSSVYGFSLMLSAFLLGLTLGSVAAGGWLKARPSAGAIAFVVSQCLTAGVVVITHLALPELPIVYVRLVEAFGQGSIGGLAILLFSGSVLLPAALGLGASLPLAAAAARGVSLSQGAARIYSANTVGAVAGTLAGGFGLLPAFGVQGALVVGVVLNILGAVAVAFPPWSRGEGLGRRVWVGAVGVGMLALGAVFRPAWDPLWMSSGIYQDLDELVGQSGEDIKDWARSGSELLFYAEGLNTAVTVGVGKKSGNIWLANNGKVDASSIEDLDTQLMLAHVPMGLKPDAQRVGVIGLASGVTLGAVTQYPADSIAILELEPAIVEASHYFDAVNDRPLEDPRVSLHLMDARRYLRWEEAPFDVLISEPSNPWISGVSNLFTQEFFLLARERLAPGGLLCQWIQLYELSQSDLKLLLRTIQGVFPEVMLFGSLDSADLIVIASPDPLELGPRQFDAAFEIPGVKGSLERLDFTRGEDVLGWYIAGTKAVEAFAGEGPINTDDNAWIEMRAPLYLSKPTASLNFKGLVEIHEGPVGRFGDTLGAEAMMAIAESYLRRDLYHFSAVTAARAIELGLPDEVVWDFKDRFRTRYDAYPYEDASAP